MLDFLGRFANFLSYDIFRPFHRLAQRVLSFIVPFTLKKIWGFRWELRRSITKKNGFHVLYSDIDLAVVFPLNVDSSRINNTLRQYAKLRSRFKFLGELEAYFEHEWQEKIQMESEHSLLLNLVRDYRKKRWVEIDLQKYSDRYHVQKAQRALRKLQNELENMDQKIREFLTPRQLNWLRTLPEWQSAHVHYYDRILPGELSSDACLFFLAVAIGPQGIEMQTEDPLFEARQLIRKYELLNYQAYYRVKETDLFASDEWISSLEKELSIPVCRQTLVSKEIPRVLLSDTRMLPDFFDLEMDLSPSISLLTSEKRNWIASQEELNQAEKALERAQAIHCSHPYYSLWIRTLYPQFNIKLRMDYQELYQEIQLISESRPHGPPARKQTLSWIAPISVRFGSQRIHNILVELKKLTSTSIHIEICTCEAPELDFFTLLEELKSQISFSDQPTGVIILPTIYSLPIDLNWTKKAQSFGLPVVAGYDANFETRIANTFNSGKSSIMMNFNYLKD